MLIKVPNFKFSGKVKRKKGKIRKQQRMFKKN